MITYSPQQQEGLEKINAYLDKPGFDDWFFLSGPAGTGKTEMAKAFNAGGYYEPKADTFVHHTQYAAYTGKAASVMRKKGCIGAQTIHSMLYRPEEDPVTGRVDFIFNENSVLKYAQRIIIDECSMCDEKIAKDLLAFGKPLVVIGDPAQLPPIAGLGYFTSGEPDYLLTEIHRQAAENPIIAASMRVRAGQKIETMGNEFRIVNDVTDEELLAADQILVGTHAQRKWVNRKMRKLHGFTDLVVPGEKLVCLRNSRKHGCYNGTTWEVKDAYPNPVAISYDKETVIWRTTLKSLDDNTTICVDIPEDFLKGTDINLPPFFKNKYQQFTYGYGLTVHKAQGSQFDKVILYDESRSFRDKSKEWLYTGITRAAESITVVR